MDNTFAKKDYILLGAVVDADSDVTFYPLLLNRNKCTI